MFISGHYCDRNHTNVAKVQSVNHRFTRIGKIKVTKIKGLLYCQDFKFAISEFLTMEKLMLKKHLLLFKKGLMVQFGQNFSDVYCFECMFCLPHMNYVMTTAVILQVSVNICSVMTVLDFAKIFWRKFIHFETFRQ